MKEVYQEQAEQELKTPLWVWHNYTPPEKKEGPVPDSVTISKLKTWGCPACSVYGSFQENFSKDIVECLGCHTAFTSHWLITWDGTPWEGKKGVLVGAHWMAAPNSDEDDFYDEESPRAPGLETLYEKVILFREAVINPDRVISDEDIETLMREMFDASYSVYDPLVEAKLELGKDTFEDVDLAPDTYHSATEYACALQGAVEAEKITQAEADDLFKAFGGPDPFNEFKDMTTGSITFDGQNIDGLNFWTAEMLDHLDDGEDFAFPA